MTLVILQDNCVGCYIVNRTNKSYNARKGELMGLRWKDVDFDRRIAYIDMTKNGERKVLPLTGGVLKELGRFKHSEPSLVFHSEIIPDKPKQ